MTRHATPHHTQVAPNRVATPREVAEHADIVITALTVPAVVRDCVLGADGVLAGLREGGLWIDHSTTDYNQTIELAAIAESEGKHALEAPITGGLTLLQEGKMTVLVGGDRALFDVHRELLADNFNTVLYMGEMGCATVTKVAAIQQFSSLHIHHPMWSRCTTWLTPTEPSVSGNDELSLRCQL
jgi:3-hydroxyisobutyrate dehydrogenase-like beta-hydroxyacid dehydrogenase